MIECTKVKRMLSRYLDKEIGGEDSVMIEAHLANCTQCSKELSELTRLKGIVSGVTRITLPQDYLVSRIRDSIMRTRCEERVFSLSDIGNFARKLIPLPIGILVASIVFLVFISVQPASKNSLEDHIFSGSNATTEMALELILGSQN